jgi:hypothetical protein
MSNDLRVTKMILDILPANMAAAFEMTPGTLRWTMKKPRLAAARTEIVKAFSENELIKDYQLEEGNISSGEGFIQVVYVS